MLYAAYRLNGDGTETLLAASLPLSEVRLMTEPLNAAPTFSWSIEPEWRAAQADDGSPILLPWSTAIYAIDDDGVLRGAGILESLTASGAKLSGKMIGWSEYVDKMPWVDAVVKRYGADPGELIELIWKKVQTHPRGNIGFEVPRIATKVTVGAKVMKAGEQPKPTKSTTTKTTAKEIITTTTETKKELFVDKNVTTTTKTVKTQNRKTKAVTTKVTRTIKTTTKARRQTTVTQTLDPKTMKVLTSTQSVTTLAAGTKVALLETEVESDEPFVLAEYATEDLKQVLDELFEVGSIDYRERHWIDAAGTIRHALDLGYPRLGSRRTDISFNLQANVSEVPEFDIAAEDYASEVLVLGAGDGDKMIRARAMNTEASRLRKVKVWKQKGIGRTTTAQTTATNLAGTFNTFAYDVDRLQVIDHDLAPMLSWSSGDEVRLTGDGMWAGQVDMWVRILSTTYNPEQPHVAEIEVIRADKVTG